MEWSRLKAPVILYDRDLPGKGWRGTVEELAGSPARACVILLSSVLDTYLRDEVVRKGGVRRVAQAAPKTRRGPHGQAAAKAKGKIEFSVTFPPQLHLCL